MPATVIRVYTDYKSPYAYVAKADTYRLEEDFDVQLQWLPYTLDIPSYLDAVDTRTAHNWRKVRYAYMDARRFANRQGLRLKGPKKIYDSRLASIGMLYAQENGAFRHYNDTLFEQFWNHELDIESPADIQRVLQAAGADPAGFMAFAEGAGGATHDRLRAEAETAGVFGVPMFMLEDELFWGGDRLPLLRMVLTERGLARRRAG